MAPSFLPPDSHIHIIARAVLVQGEKIILCRTKDSSYFFLPGGHVEDGEPARTALLRELREELGPRDYAISPLIGICENIFSTENDHMKHEINFVFRVDVPDAPAVTSQEEHLEFVAVPRDDLARHDLRPAALKESIIQWLADGQKFFKEIS